jgi:hypothetical protein
MVHPGIAYFQVISCQSLSPCVREVIGFFAHGIHGRTWEKRINSYLPTEYTEGHGKKGLRGFYNFRVFRGKEVL